MEKALKKTLSSLLIIISLQGFAQSGSSVTGNLLYHGATPMPNVHVYLYEANGTFVDSTMTSSNGVWSFSDVDAGDYYVSFYKEGPSQGVNLTDAYLVMLHLMNMYPFNDIQALAADVNGSGNITWTDYFIILINYLNQGNPFPIGNWVFEPLEFNTSSRDGFTVSGSSSGDASGTFVPTKSFEVQNINNPSTIAVSPDSDFHLELGSARQQMIGGMHLVLSIPAGLTITGIESELEDLNVDLDPGANEVRLTWMDDERIGFLLKENTPLIQFNARVSRETRTGNSYQLEIAPESHFINLNGEVVGGMELVIPAITVNLNEGSEYNLFPNPFTNQATLEFNDNRASRVTLRIYDDGGRLIREINGGGTQNGNGRIAIDGSTLSPGMYFYQLVSRDSNAILKTGPMIKSK